MSDYDFMRTVPYFVAAKTKKELVESMIKINMETNRTHNFQNISFDGKEWSAWFPVAQRELAKMLFKPSEQRAVKDNVRQFEKPKKAAKKSKRAK